MGWNRKTQELVSEQLVPAIVTAICEYGLTIDDAREHALSKMPKTKAVSYLADGFKPKHLPLPVPDNELPMPAAEGHMKPTGGGPTPAAEKHLADGAEPVPAPDLAAEPSPETIAGFEVIEALAIPDFEITPAQRALVSAAIANHGKETVLDHLRTVVKDADDQARMLGFTISRLSTNLARKPVIS